MYTSIFAVLALAASTIAAPAPIEKRQGAVTCGSTVSVSKSSLQLRSAPTPLVGTRKNEKTDVFHSNLTKIPPTSTSQSI
jgi:hypothetical protein